MTRNIMKNKKLVILGDSAFAQVAFECFSHDSDYEVVGFSVDKEFIKNEKLLGLPIVPFENITEHFCPETTFFYAAFVYTEFNRLRTRFFSSAKEKGYKPATYISSKAFVWHNVKLGEHCFIFENNTLQPFVEVGDNVVIWSGNHIGHHSILKDNIFISSHVVISGFCEVGDNSFIGVNSTIANNVSVGNDNWISMNVVVSKSSEEDKFFKSQSNGPSKISAKRFQRIKG